MGRPWPQPGEPLFLKRDTDLIIALAEEERDTCQSCGYPKAICRDPKGRPFFDVDEDFCWATYRVALRQEALHKKKAHPETVAATQIAPRLRPEHAPPYDVGLDLADRDDQD